MNILIRGGRVIDPANGIDQTRDLFIRNGKIADLGDLQHPNSIYLYLRLGEPELCL